MSFYFILSSLLDQTKNKQQKIMLILPYTRTRTHQSSLPFPCRFFSYQLDIVDHNSIISVSPIYTRMHVCVHLTSMLRFTDDKCCWWCNEVKPFSHCPSKGPRAIAKWHIVCRRSWYTYSPIIGFTCLCMYDRKREYI